MTKSAQLAALIKEDIANKHYVFGSKIPSERELSDLYNLSRGTIRKGIEQLIEEKYLERISSKGTYVIKNYGQKMMINFVGMSEQLKNENIVPETEIVAYEIREAGFKLAHIFGIKEHDRLYRIMRLRSGNAVPISIEDTYIPYKLVSQIEKIDLQIFSLYEIFSSNQIQIKNIHHSISTARVRNNEAKILNLNDGDNVVSLQISASSESEEIVEYTKVYVVPSYCSFYTDLYYSNGEATINAQNN